MKFSCEFHLATPAFSADAHARSRRQGSVDGISSGPCHSNAHFMLRAFRRLTEPWWSCRLRHSPCRLWRSPAGPDPDASSQRLSQGSMSRSSRLRPIRSDWRQSRWWRTVFWRCHEPRRRHRLKNYFERTPYLRRAMPAGPSVSRMRASWNSQILEKNREAR